jgi:hypothetical protein
MSSHKSTQNQPLNDKELLDLQFLMDKYCQRKQDLGQCNEFACAYCDIRKAYDEIFYVPNEIHWNEELFLFGED